MNSSLIIYLHLVSDRSSRSLAGCWLNYKKNRGPRERARCGGRNHVEKESHELGTKGRAKAARPPVRSYPEMGRPRGMGVTLGLRCN